MADVVADPVRFGPRELSRAFLKTNNTANVFDATLYALEPNSIANARPEDFEADGEKRVGTPAPTCI